MTNKLFSVFRYTSIIAIIVSLFVLSGCDKNDDEPAPTMTLSEIIASADYKQSATVSADVALDSLNKYINIYPDLQTLITGTSPHTLFAPSNTAFVSLTAIPGLQNIKAVNPDLIKGVLLYHLLEGQKLKADFVSGASFPTLYTENSYITTESTTLPSVQSIKINTDGTLKTGASNPSIVITKENVKATNGVLHITGSVMIPPSVGAVLVPILGKMAATVLLGKDFTLLARLIARADAGYVEDLGAGKLKITSHLARNISTTAPVFAGATFFATPNAVFEAAAAALANPVTATAFVDSFTTGADGTARKVLLNHYVIGQYVVTAATGFTTFTNGQSLANVLSGKAITVVTGNSALAPYGVGISNTPTTSSSFRPIVVKDKTASNGVIQVFGGLMTTIN
jgi:uncharacterized surface protein with fasciclin (FAS1) repeats